MIKIGIFGYGNLGKGVEAAVKKAKDMELVGIFTRRDPSTIKSETNTPVYNSKDLLNFKDKIDVLILCGGSATDLPVQTPEYVQHFNVVDSFDTHAEIKNHFQAVDKNAKSSHKIGVISVGWDPGFFSLLRLYGNAFLPQGKDYTFWGKGVSQGHSDAIRRIEGVQDARQYTIPIEKALDEVRNGKNPELTTRQKHTRECFVVAKEGADKAKIEKEIKEMPNYFNEYDTTVHFVSLEELQKNHSGLPHGGYVFRSGTTGLKDEFNNNIEFKLKLDSNPCFTGSIMIAYARACYKLNKEGKEGCMTAFDIAPKYLIDKDNMELLSTML